MKGLYASAAAAGAGDTTCNQRRRTLIAKRRATATIARLRPIRGAKRSKIRTKSWSTPRRTAAHAHQKFRIGHGRRSIPSATPRIYLRDKRSQRPVCESVREDGMGLVVPTGVCARV